jgi:hypothetical protein
LWAINKKMYIYFMANWNIYGHFGYCMTTWHIFCSLGTFFLVLVSRTKKKTSTLPRSEVKNGPLDIGQSKLMGYITYNKPKFFL